ncbi:hypothetical protein ABZP36_014032 [Zizania latifolia]
MAVRATVSRFPVTAEALEACAVQWGIAVTPFAAADERGQPLATGAGGDRVPRCESCWAYLNSHCDMERWGWSCALCGNLNGFDDDALRRFQRPDACPELSSSFIDLEILVDGSEGVGDGVQARPVYVAAVDLASRVFAFLSGAPDYGDGQLDTRRYGEQYASKGEDPDLALLPEQIPFYKDLAAVAIQAGVCVDVFAVTDEYTDLASLKFLSIESGVSLFMYTNTDDSTLPQDIYRLLSRPYAFGCVLRLRTSSDFEPGNSYGHFFPDPQY